MEGDREEEQGTDWYAWRVMRICISVVGIKIANKITKSAYKRFPTWTKFESIREKCKRCDFVRIGLEGERLEKFGNVMRERKLSKLLPGDLISRISARERRVSQGFWGTRVNCTLAYYFVRFDLLFRSNSCLILIHLKEITRLLSIDYQCFLNSFFHSQTLHRKKHFHVGPLSKILSILFTRLPRINREIKAGGKQAIPKIRKIFPFEK